MAPMQPTFTLPSLSPKLPLFTHYLLFTKFTQFHSICAYSKALPLTCTATCSLFVEENKGKRNIYKIKFPYDLQPIDKYLRHAEGDIPQGTLSCLNVNSLLETKSKLSLAIARPPGSCKSLIYRNPFVDFHYLYLSSQLKKKDIISPTS